MAIFASEEVLILLFAFCSVFSLVANAQVGYGIYAGNPKFVGGSIAHIGIALLCLGFITSERYDEQETISLERNKPVEALGYKMTYVGYAPIDNEKYAFRVDLEKDGRQHSVAPVMYYSEFTKGIMRHPDLMNLLSKDIYVAPLSLEEPTGAKEESVEIQKGQATAIGDLNVEFVDFTNVDRMAMVEGRDFTISAELLVKEGKAGKGKKLIASIKGEKGGMEPVPVLYGVKGGGEYVFTLSRILPDREDPSKSKVQLSVKYPDDPRTERKGETLVVEASIKPMINLVWMGTVTLVVGFFLTIRRRVQEARQKEPTP